MKSILIATLLLLISLQFALGQGLKIATFNCEFLVKRKVHMKYGLPFNMKYASKAAKQEWQDDRFRQKKFDEATEAVAKHLKTLHADVLGLTEVGNEAEVKLLVEALKKQGLNYPYWKVGKSDDSATGQHVALLSKYELTDVVLSFPNRGLFFVESDKDEVDETGLSKAMKATIKVNNSPIHVFLFHLKSERGGEDSDQKRLMQAELARRVMIPYLQKGEHVVVMGDLNSERRHPALLTIRGFNDIEEELIQTGDTYYFENYDTRWTYNYKGQQDQIDHILLSLSLKKACKSNNPKQKQWGIKTSILPTNNEQVSDHNALIVELSWR
ncbi:endonuclease/exonuclease/phosphatase family protein [Aureispira anguillae]|uniref:Endonuclease/exonuclease/phosphatase family protein n=1 Tax=Aureispira anguillae TaxID=2864201 RepID=A0A915YI84_9BACT|nr:endonuclease/exonuclease/phosphatase family protein [Aureispira anguillae]BDS13368.1 endonuclease/exonuclease/phosphatase family protein [Aureispira anguillae]